MEKEENMGIRGLRLVLNAFILSAVLIFGPFLTQGEAVENISAKDRERISVLVKSTDISPGGVVFSHREGNATTLDIHILSGCPQVQPEVFSFPPEENAQPIRGFISAVSEVAESPVKTGMLWCDEPGKKLYLASITVSPQAVSGLYLVSTGMNEPFTVKSTSAEKVALYCPEGFWSSVKKNGLTNVLEEGLPYYFYVPSRLKKLEIFLGRPQRVMTPRGSVALEASPENTGRVSIPVRKRGGIWSIEPAFYGSGRLGVSPPSFARLLNVEPLVAFGSPDLLPVDKRMNVVREPGPALEKLSYLEFVQGVEGRAVRLKGNKTLVFPRGRELEQGGFAHFPGREGTVEFWFKPDWSSTDIPVSKKNFVEKKLVTGPQVDIKYLYGGRNWNRQVYSDLQIELKADRKEIGLPPIGKQENHLFTEGEWTHFAWTWKTWKVSESPPALPPSESVSGSLEWPSQWRIFGPLDKSDGVLPESVLSSYPEKINLKGKTLKAKDVEVKSTLFDFPGMLQGQPTGKTAYVFILFNSPAEQEVTLGMGADWWMQAWVNGKLIHDTTETSNMHYPFSVWNHTVNVRVKKGKNVLAARFIKGGGSTLALGGPDQLRVTPLPVPAGEVKPDDGIEGEFNIFVNGIKLEDTRGLVREPFLASLKGWEIFSLAKGEEDIVIGPLDGSIDIFRISDTVRYGEGFIPSRKAPGIDMNTSVLFLFDGSLAGSSAF